MEAGVELFDWIARISKPREELGGMPVCPFASTSELSIVDTDGSDINPPPWDFGLIIYRLPDKYTIEELDAIAKEYNTMYPEMVFLPDHKDRNTFINGVQTNNGIYNLILCQWRDGLEKARSKLSGTKYYTFWDEAYLKEILGS
jgi:hypothetical protein